MITVACAGSRTPQGFGGYSLVRVMCIRWEYGKDNISLASFGSKSSIQRHLNMGVIEIHTLSEEKNTHLGADCAQNRSTNTKFDTYDF